MNEWGSKVNEALGRVQASAYSLIGVSEGLRVTPVGFEALEKVRPRLLLRGNQRHHPCLRLYSQQLVLPQPPGN